MKTSIRQTILFLIVNCTLLLSASAQKNNYDLFEMLGTHQLGVVNREPTTFSEGTKRGIRFEEREEDGIAWIKGLTFSNGTIELDIKGRNVLQKSFLGVVFHGVDNQTTDIVYFRPFNFRTTDSVRRIHAVQYVSSPDYGWKRLRDEQNGKFEKAIEPAPGGDDWFHTKIVINYPHVEVYVNDIRQPSLSVDKLNQRKSGKLGLWVGPLSTGDFANLKITPQ